LATSAIADYETEYTTKYEEEQFIEITPENYNRLSESLENNSVQVKRGKVGTPAGLKRQTLCSCVTTAKILANKEFSPIGYARNLKPNTDKPEVGDIIITDESYAGHLAVIKQIWADTYIIMEGNYERCAYTEREISKTYNKIIGFYH